MNNHLAPANFIETRDLPKITHKVPIIEGLDMNEEIEKIYTDANEIIPKNIAYLKCASENENHCNVLQNTMNEKEISLNALTDLRNKSTLDYETCDTQLKSCQMLYNDLNTKTQEFKNIYDEINNLNEMIGDCGAKKITCDDIEKEINKLERIIFKYEKNVTDLKHRAKKNKC